MLPGSDNSARTVFTFVGLKSGVDMKNKALPLSVMLGFAFFMSMLSGCSKAPVRTDAQIATEIQGKLYGDPKVQSKQIEVQAANGVVTLNGQVAGDDERAAAGNDAATVEGVRTVVNNLQVQQAQAAPAPVAVAPPPAPNPAPAKPHKTREEAASKRHRRMNESDAAKPVTAMQAENTPPPQEEVAPPDPAPPSAPAPPPPPQKITIPAGTQLTIRLNDPLDSERNQVGDTFHAALSAPIVIGGETIIPSGADVVGRVADVKSAGRFAGNSALTLELTSLSVNGRTYNVQTSQWSRSGQGEGKNTATKVGVGTAAGAVLGGIFGGGKGAAIGAAAGAGAGTGVAASKKGQQIKLEPEAVLNFQIINPLTITPQGSNDRNAGRTPLS